MAVWNCLVIRQGRDVSKYLTLVFKEVWSNAAENEGDVVAVVLSGYILAINCLALNILFFYFLVTEDICNHVWQEEKWSNNLSPEN